MVVVISIEKYQKILAQEKFRGHPGLNQGPLDLQSNALPLSYIPSGVTRFPQGIHGHIRESTYHVRARAYLTTNMFFVQINISQHN